MVLALNPELTWLHSATVASLTELLVVTGFGVNRTPNISATNVASASKDEISSRENQIGQILTALMDRSFEKSYLICEQSLDNPRTN